MEIQKNLAKLDRQCRREQRTARNEYVSSVKSLDPLFRKAWALIHEARQRKAEFKTKYSSDCAAAEQKRFSETAKLLNPTT